MGHASEYSHKLVSAEDAVRGTVRHHASSPPYLDEFPGQEEEDEMYPVIFPGLAHAATCELGREDFATATVPAIASCTTRSSAITD